MMYEPGDLNRQREVERRPVDVRDVGGHVKELPRDVGDLDRDSIASPRFLRHRRRRDEDADRPGEIPDITCATGLEVNA